MYFMNTHKVFEYKYTYDHWQSVIRDKETTSLRLEIRTLDK